MSGSARATTRISSAPRRNPRLVDVLPVDDGGLPPVVLTIELPASLIDALTPPDVTSWPLF